MNKYPNVLSPPSTTANNISITDKSVKPYNESHNVLKNLPTADNKNSSFHYRENTFTSRKNNFSSSTNPFHNITHKYTTDCPNCDK